MQYKDFYDVTFGSKTRSQETLFIAVGSYFPTCYYCAYSQRYVAGMGMGRSARGTDDRWRIKVSNGDHEPEDET